MDSTLSAVKDILDAIQSVRVRVKTCVDQGDQIMARQLMGDLYALELCLVGETQRLIILLDEKDTNKVLYFNFDNIADDMLESPYNYQFTTHFNQVWTCLPTFPASLESQ